LKARYNILATVLGLSILLIVTAMGAPESRAAVGHGAHGTAVSKDHATSSRPSRVVQHDAHQNGMAHHGHGEGPSCWEYCADLLVTTFTSMGHRNQDVVTVDRKRPGLAEILSADEVPFRRIAIHSRTKNSVPDHRTGVSGLLRTSMRLRN